MQVKSTFPGAKLVIRVLTDDSKSHCKYVSYECNHIPQARVQVQSACVIPTYKWICL